MGRDYEKYSKEELINHIKSLENQLKSQKYGLYWDRNIEEENIVKTFIENIPVLKLDKNRSIITSSTHSNILIEGDNFISLSVLNMVKPESIDLIYIDPPYGTGHVTSDGGFKYNDKFVNLEDGFKHSKWISFMEKRLILAKQLLAEDGSIFISIDDHEVADLKLLCDKIFGENKYVTCIPRLTKAQRAGQERYMDISHDYIICYSKANDFSNIIDRDYDESKICVDDIGHYIKGDTKAILAALSQGYSKGGDYDFEYNGKIYQPITKEGIRNRWLWSKNRMEAAAKLGILVETKSTLRMQLYIDKRFDESTNTMVEKDEKLIFHTSDFMTNFKYTNSSGVSDLDNISKELTKKFNNPKPVELLKKIISFHTNKNAKVLDFFAGSGTTGQAVLELNKEDNGNRSFILCTNNENNICEEVTYNRLKTVITGIRKDGTKYSDGLPSNLIYMKTDFVKSERNTDQAKYSLVEKVDGLLCIIEDTFVESKRDNSFVQYSNYDKTKHMFIYNDIYNEDEFKKFKDLINETTGEVIAYIYSSDNTIDKFILDELPLITIKPIPSKIFEIYKEIIEDVKRG